MKIIYLINFLLTLSLVILNTALGDYMEAVAWANATIAWFVITGDSIVYGENRI